MLETYTFITYVERPEIMAILKTLLLVIVGFFIAQICSHACHKVIGRYASSQQAMILQKIIYFTILTLFIVAAMEQLGFKLSVLLGSVELSQRLLQLPRKLHFQTL